jgi:hypothetical protein
MGEADPRPAFRTEAIMRILLNVLIGLAFLTLGPEQPVSAASAPATDVLSISTLPATPGLPVTVDGTPAVTGADGTVAVPTVGVTEMLRIGNLSSHISVQGMDTVRDGVPVRVSPARILKMGGAVVITLDVAWQVQFRFVGTGSADIDQDKIGMVTIKSSTGEVETIDPHEPIWLQGSRVVPQAGGMVDKKMYWTVQNVPYEGANVVNASQQQVVPADTQTFEVELLFYTAHIRAHDAFFGWSAGSGVAMTYPDGHVKVLPMDDDGELVLGNLPRGSYSLTILGAGPRMIRPLAISRDQDLDLEFYSWFDIAVVVVLLSGFVAATVLIGMRRRKKYRPSENRDRHSSWRGGRRAPKGRHRRLKTTGGDVAPPPGPPVVRRIGRLDAMTGSRGSADEEAPSPNATLVGNRDA